MKKYAVLDINNRVQDIIVADSVEDAELASGKTCVEFNDSNPAIVGLGYSEGIFEQVVFEPPTL